MFRLIIESRSSFSFTVNIVKSKTCCRWISIFCFLLFLFAVSPLALKGGEETLSKETNASLIVTLDKQVDAPRKIARQFATSCDCEVEHVFRHAIKGFALRVSNEDLVHTFRNRQHVRQIVMGRRFNPGKEPSRGRKVRSNSSYDEQRIPYGIRRIGAKKFKEDQNGNGVNVAVIDSGIAKQHPDLQENLKGGINTTSDQTDDWADRSGHGTHVAGIIAAEHNRRGVVGVAPEANLYAVRVLSRQTAGMADVLAGIDWVARPDRTRKMDVANISLGAPLPQGPSPLRRAIQNATEKGVTFTSAAGNGSIDVSQYVPARYGSVITVGAVDGSARTDGRNQPFASFSNYGNALDLVAPGVHVQSTFPNHRTGIFSGTNTSAAHAAGTAARLLEQHEHLSPEEVRKSLIRSGESAPGCENQSSSPGSTACGWKNYPGKQRNIPLVRADGLKPIVNGISRIPGGDESRKGGCGLKNPAENRDELLDHYMQILRDFDRNYHPIGTVLEVLALKKLRNEYPDHYKISDSVAYYNESGRTLGEMDLVVYNQRTEEVEKIVEVKLTDDYDRARKKARRQLNRIKRKLRQGKVADFRDMTNPNNDFNVEDFCCVETYVKLSSRGALCHEFDYELDLKREEGDLLHDRLGF